MYAAYRESEDELKETMKTTVSENLGECRLSDSALESPVAPPPPPPVVTRSSSTASEDSSSDLMEHFLSELDLVFSDILAEEVSQSVTSFRLSVATGRRKQYKNA